VKYPSDIFPSSRFYADDLGEPPIRLSGPSRVTISDAPGIGVQPNPDRLAKLTVQQGVVQ